MREYVENMRIFGLKRMFKNKFLKISCIIFLLAVLNVQYKSTTSRFSKFIYRGREYAIH